MFAFVVVAIIALTMSDAERNGIDPNPGGDEIAPPPTVEGDGTRPPLNSLALPGSGSVTAILELEGELVAIAAGDFWGSSIWRLDETSGIWESAGGVAGVRIVDAVVHPDGLAAVGVGTFDRSPVLLIGPATDLRQISLEFVTGEIPYEIDIVAGSLFVSARFQAGSGGPPSNIYLIEGEQRPRPVDFVRNDAVVEDVVAREGEVFAVGSEAGRPAMWRVGAGGGLTAIDLDLGVESGRIAAAGHVSGAIVGLVIGGTGTELASTSVYRLEPPVELLDEPIPGTWDRLVIDGDHALALPDQPLALPDGELTTYRTASGVSWVAGRARFVPPGEDERGERTMLIEDALFRESGDLVVAGAASGQWPYPVVASEGTVGRSFEIPIGPWALVDEVEGGREIVHIGGMHVSLHDDVVTVREGFGRSWAQPVFADEPSVGGAVDVVELDIGVLLAATEPYRALWFSTDGLAWQLIELDVVAIAGSGDSAIAIVRRDGGLDVARVDRSGVSELEPGSDLEPPFRGSLGHVPGLGYVTGPVDGRVYLSDSGAVWTELELGIRVDDLQYGDGAIAVRTASGWLRYSAAGAVTPITTPDDDSVLGPDAFLVDGGLSVLDGGFWVTSDFARWTEVPFGIWEGADGPLVFLEVSAREVVAQLGGESEGSLFALSR
ncbi:MAG: hypothetical protein OEQ47_05530 [Acidimicrobiia bacterium]|nr:hypothetical protein [Acidimicrobiia bacterium]